MSDDSRDVIEVRGARQNNLKNLDLQISAERTRRGDRRLGIGQVVTCVRHALRGRTAAIRQRRSRRMRGSSSTVWTSRRWMLLLGSPPAIAIDQTNPVRTSRSTVGTMTELNDHLKLLFARAATLYCQCCGKPVRRDTPESIYHELHGRAVAAGDPRLLLSFPVSVPANFKEAEVRDLLEKQGYTRFFETGGSADANDKAVPRRRGSLVFRGSRGEDEIRAEERAKRRVQKGRCASVQNPHGDPGPLPHRQRRTRPCAGVSRSGAESRPGSRSHPRGQRRRSTEEPRLLEVFERAPLRSLRPELPRADPQPVLVQLAGRRVRDLQGLRPDHRHRLRSRHPR